MVVMISSIEYNRVGSITRTIDATLLPFFGGQCTIVGLEPASLHVFRLTRNEERGPVLTAATHQAPEVCAVMLQKARANVEHAPNTCAEKEGSGRRTWLCFMTSATCSQK